MTTHHPPLFSSRAWCHGPRHAQKPTCSFAASIARCLLSWFPMEAVNIYLIQTENCGEKVFFFLVTHTHKGSSMVARVMLQGLTFALCAIVVAGVCTVAGLPASSLFGGMTIRCPAHWRLLVVTDDQVSFPEAMSHGATVSGALNCTNDLPTFKNCTKNVTLVTSWSGIQYCKYIQETYDCFPSKRPDRALTPDRAPGTKRAALLPFCPRQKSLLVASVGRCARRWAKRCELPSMRGARWVAATDLGHNGYDWLRILLR